MWCLLSGHFHKISKMGVCRILDLCGRKPWGIISYTVSWQIKGHFSFLMKPNYSGFQQCSSAWIVRLTWKMIPFARPPPLPIPFIVCGNRWVWGSCKSRMCYKIWEYVSDKTCEDAASFDLCYKSQLEDLMFRARSSKCSHRSRSLDRCQALKANRDYLQAKNGLRRVVWDEVKKRTRNSKELGLKKNKLNSVECGHGA